MQRYEEDGKLPNNKYDIWLTFLNLSDYQSVRLASFRFNYEVAILLNHRFDTANQGIERFTGIRFLGPKSITNLLFGELMMRIVEEELHQLVLHRSKLDGLSAFLIVEGILVLRIAHGAEHISLMIPGLFSAMIV